MKNKIDVYQDKIYLRKHPVTIYTNYHSHNIQCGATSYYRSALEKGIGELVERLCLYTIQPCKTIQITGGEPDYIVNYIGQKKNQVKSSSLFLDMVEAINLSTMEKTLVPLGLISFHPATKGAELYPFCDTTGCAIHLDFEHAFDNALLEFCERQAFFGCYYGNLPIQKVMLGQEISMWREGLPINYQQGTFLAFDFGLSFNCHVIFLVLQNTDKNCCQILTGLGCALNLSEALDKAYNELLQICKLSHRKVFLEKDETFIKSVSIKSFQHFFTKQHKQIVNTIQANYSNNYAINDIVRTITLASDRVWLYSFLRVIDGNNYTFCKIFSPDFYLISQWQNRNFGHKFEKTIGVSVDDYHEKCPVFI